MTIRLLKCDITTLEVDAIVNAANENLFAGGGVCGAIHRAAGIELERDCKSIGGCEVGNVVLTNAYNLASKYVAHAVGPRWLGGNQGEAELLESCYRNIFNLATKHNIESLAIPAISTGIYNYPLEEATGIAVRVAQEYDSDGVEVVFACYDENTFNCYKELLK